MDTDEAGSILAKHLTSYRALMYTELAERVDTVETAEVRAPSGVEYQLEVQFFWDSKANHDVRVIGSVDDGGWRASVPQSCNFPWTCAGARRGIDGTTFGRVVELD